MKTSEGESAFTVGLEETHTSDQQGWLVPSGGEVGPRPISPGLGPSVMLPYGSSLLSRVTCSPELILRCKPRLSTSELLSLSAPACFSACHKDAARGSSSATRPRIPEHRLRASQRCASRATLSAGQVQATTRTSASASFTAGLNDPRCQWDLTSLTYNVFLNFFFF